MSRHFYLCIYIPVAEHLLLSVGVAVGVLVGMASVAVVIVGLDSAAVSVLMRKLGFLYRLLDGRDNAGSVVIGTLMDDDVESVVLIQECHGLEEEFGTDFTS